MTDGVRVLTRVEVVDLLGRFNHTIGFPADDEFVIIHGPNGVGKTMLLDLITAVASPMDIVKIARLPFAALVLHFNDGSVLEVRKEAPVTTAEERLMRELDAAFSVRDLAFFLQGPALPHQVSWSPQLDNA
ncbi:hypothetical protein [Actinacidiphila sp. bgisy145]|uniref:hypothetical protein n=1 Tax=Actinacidiphila sp. bgisy145 TaxID=3413792 RepID=UPI003EB7E41F